MPSKLSQSLLALACATYISIPSISFAEQDQYLFILKGRGNVFWKVIREGIEETAKAKGIDAVILNTDDDQTPEAQLNICTASLARKPKVVVMGAATKNIGIECYKKANAENILTADIDGNVSLEDAKAANIPLAFTVGSDNNLIGKKAAEFLLQSSKSKTPKILVLKGLPGSIVSEKRAQGFLDQLKAELPGAIIVGTPTTDWDRMKAMNITLDYLQREPQLDYIYSVSDAMSMGVVEALRVANKSDQIQILSVDGNADARKAMVQGRIAANVAQLPYLMGKRSVELAIASAEGSIREYTEYIPTPVLTKEYLEKNEDPNLKYLR